MSLAPVSLMWGEGRAANYARYWFAEPVAADDGEPWSIAVESNDAAPAGLGGEAVFTAVFLTVRAAAGAALKITPILNDDDSLVRTHPTGTITVQAPQIIVPQQAGGPPTPMLTATFSVPLLYRLTAAGGKHAHVFNPRGERCRIRIESVGDIGTGAFRLEQAELEYEVIRRSFQSTFTP